MLADIVKDPRFRTVFSFILGFAIASLTRPLCASQGGSVQCKNYKAPDIKDMTDHVYRLGGKCYQFSHNTVDCPTDSKKQSIIEAFW